MNEQTQSKWTGPDEVNGVLHVGKGYRQATCRERFRADREQWYPGDSENGENGIWADTRPGSFHPTRVYRVPVERKDEPGIHGDSRVEAVPPPVVRESETEGLWVVGVGYRFADIEDRFRGDRERFIQGPDGGWGRWVRAVVGDYDDNERYRVPTGDRMPTACKATEGYRFAGNADRHRMDRMEWVSIIGRGNPGWAGWWCEASPGAYHPSRLYQVPTDITAASYPPSQGEGTRLEKADQQEPTMTAEHATGILGWHMRADSDFAWTWHCNIAMAAADAGAPIKEANERAADFMRNAFGVDVRDCEQWKAAQSQAVPPPVGEFEDGGREGWPDYHPGKCDAVEPEHLTAADFLRQDSAVDHPNHYNAGPIECIDAIRAAFTAEEFRGFCKGNAIKYVWRERGKGGDEDLHKGGWYLVAATGKPTAAEGRLLEVIRELHDFAEPTRISEYADRARQAFRDAAILLGESGF